ncbi:MAG: hypothetical protein N3D18_06700 [Roseococcus sp.]|nr:hypothetical protein [Roseococcus sp.]
MTETLLALLALAYSGLVLFALAQALRRLMAPRRAAVAAFGLSSAVHGATLLFLDPAQRPVALALWGAPHLLLLPLLLWAARRQETGA